MYAMTIDQIGSQTGDDLVDEAIAQTGEILGDRATLPPERTAGDEFQLLTDSAEAALDTLLHLTRVGGWSVGLGVGDARHPLPTSTRAASGSAFVRARAAVERAKGSPDHFAVDVDADRRFTSGDVEAILAQTLRQRARRSPEGWQVADLIAQGHTRTEAAQMLGISPQAVAKRFAAADLRNERALHAALSRLLSEADQRR